MWLSGKELFWALLYSTHTPTIVGNKNIFRLSFLINNCRRAPKRSSLSTYILLMTTFCTHFIRFDFNFWFRILTFFPYYFNIFFLFTFSLKETMVLKLKNWIPVQQIFVLEDVSYSFSGVLITRLSTSLAIPARVNRTVLYIFCHMSFLALGKAFNKAYMLCAVA